MQKRIVLNLKDIDFEEDSDEDIGWTPPQDYNEIEEKFFVICPFRSKFQGNLNRHIHQVHKNNKKRKNENQVPEIANKKTKLTEGKTFPCDYCGFNFTTKVNMKRHEKNKHGK